MAFCWVERTEETYTEKNNNKGLEGTSPGRQSGESDNCFQLIECKLKSGVGALRNCDG